MAEKELEQKNTLFTKEQLLASDRYEGQRDLINALIPDGVSITLSELDTKIEEFRKGKVKR